MPRRGVLARCSIKEWTVRGLLAASALVLGYFSVIQSFASLLARGDAALAHRLAPYDGRITALLAASLAGPEASDDDRKRSDMFARLALRQDATTVAAVGTLGLNAQFRGNTAVARQFFAYAQKLSRRDLRTQLWMIEDAVGRGDIMGALRQYDITLRTAPRMANILFPILASASTDPSIRSGLVRTFANKAPWGNDFANYLASNNADPRSTAALFVDLWRAGVAVPKTARAGAIDALIIGHDAEKAWSYYAMTHIGVDRRRSRDPHFAGIDTPTPFDWVAINGKGVTSSIQGNSFDFVAPASVGGPLLRQVQLLSPGEYRVTGHSDGIDQAERSRPYWVLSCQSGRELGRVDVPNSSQARGNFIGSFSVPAECPIQILMLVARPSDAVSGLSGRLDRAQIAPLEQRDEG